MTVKTAELAMAIILGVLSALLMYQSARLEIGWIPEEGPGGGAWPFWLSAVMLGSCIVTTVRWFTRATPQSRSDEPFMDSHTWKVVAITVTALTVTLGLVNIIGMYFALMLFMIFYLRFVGFHTWLLSLLLGISLPVIAFFFFEGLLKIIMPKGYAEPLFYPLYRLIY